jgi:PAS domain S-box-containing protein
MEKVEMKSKKQSNSKKEKTADSNLAADSESIQDTADKTMNYKIQDIIDIEKVRDLIQAFSRIADIPISILDLDGNILIGTGWQDICTYFHRKCPKTALKCTKSDTILAEKSTKGEKYNIYKCLNGMVDVAVPIIVRNQHIGNLFTGQLLLEEPDKEFFRQQAKKYGFDEAEYMEALSKVSIIPEDLIKEKIHFMLCVTNLLCEMGLRKTDELEAIEYLHESEQIFQMMFEHHNAVMLLIDPGSGKIVDANNSASKFYGFSREELHGMSIDELNLLSPERILEERQKAKNLKQNYFVFPHKLKNGDIRTVEVHSTPIKFHGKVILFSIIHDITERTMAEDELKHSEHSLKRTQEIGNMGSWQLDINKNQLLWSDENYRIFGIPIGTKLTYETFLNCVHPDDRNFVDQEWKAALNAKPYDIEHRLLVNGKVKWVREKAEITFDNKGSVLNGLGFTQDITEQKKAEEELKKKEERFKLAQKAGNVGIWERDLETDKVWWSDNVEVMFGVKKGSFKATFNAYANCIHPDDRGRVKKEISEIRANGKGFITEYRIIKPDKTIRWMTDQAEVFTDDAEQQKLIGTVTDITDQKNVEQSIRENEKRFQTIFEQAAVGVAQIDSNTGQFIHINKRYASIIGYTIEEMKNISFKEITYPEDLQEYLGNMSRILKDKTRKFSMEKRYIHKNGSMIWVNLTVSPLWNPGEKPTYHIAVVEDITEHKKNEKLIIESESKFRALFEQSGSYCMVLDPNTPDGIPVIIDANKAACDIHGYSKKEFIGKPVADIDDEEGKKLCKERTALIMTGKLFYMENTHVRKDGSTFDVAINAKRIDIGDNPPLIFTTGYDISERKQAEKEIKNLAKFPSENPNPILRISNQGEVLYANDSGNKILKILRKINEKKVSQAWQKILKHCAEKQKNYTEEQKIGKRIFSLTYTYVEDADYINVYGQNITDRKNSELEREESQRQLKTLMNNLLGMTYRAVATI